MRDAFNACHGDVFDAIREGQQAAHLAWFAAQRSGTLYDSERHQQGRHRQAEVSDRLNYMASACRGESSYYPTVKSFSKKLILI